MNKLIGEFLFCFLVCLYQLMGKNEQGDPFFTDSDFYSLKLHCLFIAVGEDEHTHTHAFFFFF